MSMAALLGFTHLLSAPKRTLALSLTVFAALMSKESSVLFIPLLMLSQYIITPFKPLKSQHIAIGVPTLLWGILRFSVISSAPELSIIETLKALPIASACLITPLSCPAAAPLQRSPHWHIGGLYRCFYLRALLFGNADADSWPLYSVCLVCCSPHKLVPSPMGWPTAISSGPSLDSASPQASFDPPNG